MAVYGPLAGAFPAAVAQTTAAAIKGAPVRTGELRRSIHQTITGAFSASIVAGSGHAAAVDKGTRPHSIKPINKKALAGKNFGPFKGTVDHPGTQGTNFMGKATATFPALFGAQLRARLGR